MASLKETSDKDIVKGNKSAEKKSIPKSNEKRNLHKSVLNKSKNNSGSDVTKSAMNGMKNEDVEDVANKGTELASNMGKSAINGVKKAPSNIKSLARTPQRIKESIQNLKKKRKKAKKRIKQIKNIIKRIKRIILFMLKVLVKLIVTFWWAILGAVIIGIFANLVFTFMNTASVKGNLFIESEVVGDYNKTNYTEQGELEITEVTMENKLVRAFYYYFSEKSVWMMTDKTVETKDGKKEIGISTEGKAIQFRSEEYIKLFGDPDEEGADVVKDKYGRESEFYINPNALYVLDKYLHDQKFRFPEQIVKHVAFEKNKDYVEGGTTGSGTFIGNGNEEIAWNYYRSVGFSEEQTAGLLGNIYVESHFDTQATNGSHWGIHQWGGSRYIALQTLASSKGKAWTDITIQLEYAYSELNNSAYKSNMDGAGWSKSGLSVTEAADIVRLYYEICGTQGMNERREAAQRYYNQFKGKSVSDKKDNNTSTTISDAYASWKQYDSRWGSMTLGSSSETVADVGCFATSTCVLAAYSGATSKDENVFNPSIGIPQLSFTNDACLYYKTVSSLGDGSLTHISETSTSSVSNVVNEILSNVDKGNFYIIHVTNHYMPVVGVTDNEILINDVGSSMTGVTLSEYLAKSGRGLLGFITYKSSKTNMKECGNISYNGSTGSTGVNSVPYKLKQLTDDDGNVCVESTKYKLIEVEEHVYRTEITTKKETVNGLVGTTKEFGTYIVQDKDGNETWLKSKKIHFGLFDSVDIDVTYEKQVDTGETVTKKYYTPTDEKETGVWDYGFGSIVFYNKYIESSEVKDAQVTSMTFWDPDKKSSDGTNNYGETVTYTRDQYNTLSQAEKDRLQSPISWDEKVDPWGQETNETYLIKWAITPAGTITNGISFNEVNTGEVVPRDEPITKTKTVEKLEYVTETITEEVKPGETLVYYTQYDKNDKPIESSSVTYKNPKKDKNGKENKTVEKTYNKSYYKKISQTITFSANVTGNRYTWQANYTDDNVDLSGITGTRYYKDYLYNYSGYAPISVQGTFNFNQIKSRTGMENDEDLDKILENSTFTKNDTTSLGFFDSDGTYTGLGSIQTRYETGSDVGTANVGHWEFDGYNPGWGFANFTAENCINFMNWLKGKDPKFYNKYFGGVTIAPNGGKSTPFYAAWQAAANGDQEQFTMYYISFSYKNDCYDNVLNKPTIKDDPVLGQIDFTRSFPLQEMVYTVGCAAPKILIEVLHNCGITVDDTDAEIITKMGNYMSTDSFCENWYKSIYWKGVKNRWSLSVKTSQTNMLLKYIEDNGDVSGFTYDEETEMLIAGDGTVAMGSRENIFLQTWHKLKKMFGDMTSFVSKILLGKQYSNVLDSKYWTKIQGGALKDKQADWVLSAMFAYNDEDKVTEYEIDDEYFKLKYQQLFSSEGTTGSGATVKDRYFGGKVTNPLKDDTDAKIISKYNSKTDQMLILSVKQDTDIKAVSNGQVIKVGYDSKYGGDYVMIQHSGCVSIYGHLNTSSVQKGQTVKEGDSIGKTRTEFYFGLRTKPKGNYINPTNIFEEEVSGTYLENGLKIPLILQGNYPNPIFSDGASIAKAGCGFTSCAMVASYLTGKNISPVEIVNKFQSKYYCSDGMSWDLPSAVAKEYNLGNVTETTDSNAVLKALSEGKPVLSSQSPGIFTTGGHIIVLRGTDGNGNVYVNDPASQERSGKKYNMKKDVDRTSRIYWIFNKTKS